MKKPTAKIIVKPHYIGIEQRGKILKRVIAAEVQKKIKLREVRELSKTT